MFATTINPLRPIPKAALVNKMPLLMGLEVELSEWGYVKQLNYPTLFRYNCVHDGSVRPSGQEMVLSPLKGDKFLGAMWELAQYLHCGKAKVNNTCGFHVHVDARTLHFASIRRLITIYTALEEEIYGKIISENRAMSSDCQRYYAPSNHQWKPLYPKLWAAEHPGEIKQLLSETLYGVKYIGAGIRQPAPNYCKGCGVKCMTGRKYCRSCQDHNKTVNTEVLRIRAQKYGNGLRSRYWGLNIHSFFYRGTVEFRMFEGTTNLSDLVCWPLFCGWLIHLSDNITDRTAKSITTIDEFLDTPINGGKKSPIPSFIGTWVANRSLQRTTN